MSLAAAKERAHQKRSQKKAPTMDWNKRKEVFSSLWRARDWCGPHGCTSKNFLWSQYPTIFYPFLSTTSVGWLPASRCRYLSLLACESVHRYPKFDGIGAHVGLYSNNAPSRRTRSRGLCFRDWSNMLFLCTAYQSCFFVRKFHFRDCKGPVEFPFVCRFFDDVSNEGVFLIFCETG